jgi:hypothetical protein
MPIEVDPSQVHSIEVDPSQVTAVGVTAPAAAPSAPSVGGFLRNAVSSGVNLIGNVGHAILHPDATMDAVGNVVEGLGNEYLPGYSKLKSTLGGTDSGLAQQNATADAFKKNIVDRYGSIDNFAHTLYTDPAGVLADVSALAGGIGGAARGVGAVADLAGAADVASGASKVANVAKTVEAVSNPVTQAGKVVRAAGGAAARATGVPTAGELAASFYESALKPSLAAKNVPKIPGLVQAGLENAIPVSVAGADKLAGLIDDANKAIKARIDTGAAAGVTIDPQSVATRVDKVRPRFENQVNPVADLKAIDRSKSEFLAQNSLAAVPPEPTNVLAANGSMIMTPGTPAQVIPIPADVAQAMKQNTYAQLRNSYGQLSSAEVESQKALARGIKEELVQAFPEIADLNAHESKLIDLDGALRKALPRIANKDMIGIGTPIVAGAAGAVTGGAATAAKAAWVLKSVLDNPAVKSRLAITLSAAARMKTPAKLASVASTVPLASVIGSRIDKYVGSLGDYLNQSGQPQLQPAVP